VSPTGKIFANSIPSITATLTFNNSFSDSSVDTSGQIRCLLIDPSAPRGVGPLRDPRLLDAPSPPPTNDPTDTDKDRDRPF
jgi:hypothetical protein